MFLKRLFLIDLKQSRFVFNRILKTARLFWHLTSVELYAKTIITRSKGWKFAFNISLLLLTCKIWFSGEIDKFIL